MTYYFFLFVKLTRQDWKERGGRINKRGRGEYRRVKVLGGQIKMGRHDENLKLGLGGGGLKGWVLRKFRGGNDTKYEIFKFPLVKTNFL